MARTSTLIISGRLSDPNFWSPPAAHLLADLETTPAGLSAAEAARRLRRDGPNTVADPPTGRLITRIGRRLIEPLIAILIVAATISGITGDITSCLIIAVMVGLSVVLDVVQEQRAELAALALKRSVAVYAQVRRDGIVQKVPAYDLARGDVVLLAAGDLIPADGVVLESRTLFVNEALLTGEPYPVEKRLGPSNAATASEAFDALFGGAGVISGQGAMLVVETGPRTRFGGIAAALESREPPTAFQRGLHDLGVLIVRLTVFLVLFVLLVLLAQGRPPLESFMFAVALAVGLTPELLPMVMTVTLSRGAMRMAKQRVVVKRLAAIHDLGAMDVLCTDKTGTLTEAQITLVGHPGPQGTDVDRVIELAAVNSRFETGVRSPLDDAILAHTHDFDVAAWHRLDDVPFDFERRRVSVLAEKDGARFVIVKGAPEELLARAIAFDDGDGQAQPLHAATRQSLVDLHTAKSRDGLRLLGVAWRQVDAACTKLSADDERDLVFAGYCTFVDPPKASAAQAVEALRALGVHVKIVSGDALEVISHLVAALNLPARGTLTGPEMAELDDAALQSRIQQTDLFARMAPDQKTRVIRALQAAGHTVGFIGDGINDAPAIKAADVGLSVEGASDVARAAADMILLAPDLGVLASGVREGRRTYANIMKYVRMGTSSNFGNMLSMALASLVIPFLPLTAVQILLNNLLYDLSETGIPLDQVDAADVAAPRGWDMADLRRFTIVMGPLSSAFDLLTFAILLWMFHAEPATFRTAWFIESISTQILVIFLIRTTGRPWRSRPSATLTATSLGALALALFAALGPFQHVLGFAPVPAALLAAIAGLVCAYLVCAEALKRHAIRRVPASWTKSL